ncbi:tetratricopeptide repeat protein [Ramlibacter sp. H39-3-26]|uniref:YfgM family protein n=1 Tax=Curvibacter soli TaxID=3031331 RepID=UPI0023D9F323|nr:tetratricopeptide repeat protein [Ramlibacter sp. H39-3-26]MDF1485447.1 tetratricopeptide repeat protein [Ramlibacter sp. H39-3-26]
MAQHLDLEEQEQIDQLKHFWNTYGTLITALLVLAFGALAAWNGYQFWQNRQAVQASALFDAIDTAAKAGDTARLEQAFGDIKDKYPSTAYAYQAGLLAGKVLFEKGQLDAAKATLGWVAEKSGDDGLAALARLRLAGVLIQQQAYDQALAQLGGSVPASFAPLVADRKGDIYLLQGKQAEAIQSFTQAYKDLDDRLEYRRLVEVKLNALGVDPQAAIPGAQS